MTERTPTTRLGDQIAAAFNDVQEPPTVCAACGGDGWYIGHEDECYDTGDCNCSGVQVECETCRGAGKAST